MNTMSYKGYAARIEFDAEDRIFIGHVAGIRDTVGFHGASVAELEQAFHEAVDDYVRACEKLGQRPERPASGKLMLRVPPAVHASALRSAELEGLSLNQWATQVLSAAALPRK
jgi:predicted HicB family RNase H-like nuclease